MNKAELAEQFRILMLALGIDQQCDADKANEWIDDHALAIERGFMAFDPIENVLKCHVEDEPVERIIRLTKEGIAYLFRVVVPSSCTW